MASQIFSPVQSCALPAYGFSNLSSPCNSEEVFGSRLQLRGDTTPPRDRAIFGVVDFKNSAG